MKKLFFFFSSIVAITLFTPAEALYDGTSALGSKLVLTIATTKETRNPFCTAAMLTERIVVTAAHCVAKDQGEYPDLRFKTNEIYVTQPGVNVNTDDIETRVKILKVVYKPGYQNIWKPEIGDESTQRDDIAFIFLEKALIENYAIKIATFDEVEEFVKAGRDVIHYGYGLQKVNVQDGGPYTLKLKAMAGYPTKTDLNSKKRFNTSTAMFSKEDGRALCPGDSGGPWYGEIGGEIKILAVTVAASGCRSQPPYTGNTLGTLIHPYLEFMNQEWINFLAEEATLRAEMYQTNNRFEIAKKNGNLIVSTGCHASGISAELQIKSANNWKVISPSYGMVASDKSCPSTNPATPWTVADIPDNSLVRWRYWSPGSRDFFGEPFIYNKSFVNPVSPTPTPSQSATPLVSPSPSAQPTSSKKPFIVLEKSSKKTITCFKGKTVRKISAINPVCPKGFKTKK